MVHYKSEQSKIRIAEARKRGHKTKFLLEQKKIDEYDKNPKLCQCGKAIGYSKRNDHVFCSRSCWIKYGDFAHNIGKDKFCELCGKKLVHQQKKYCSINCSTHRSLEDKIKKLEAGLLNDHQARRLIREISDKKCSICGLEKWNGEDIPLVADHIDGDHINNRYENLRMVCCNCDALLPTYKGRNKGNGRLFRRK